MYDVNGGGRVQLEELKQVMNEMPAHHDGVAGEEQAEELYAKMEQGGGGGGGGLHSRLHL